MTSYVGDPQISVREERDKHGQPMIVGTCKCGRTWLIKDPEEGYRYSIENWNRIIRIHLASNTHKRKAAPNT